MKPSKDLTCWDKIRGKSTIQLSEIALIAYGGISSTF